MSKKAIRNQYMVVEEVYDYIIENDVLVVLDTPFKEMTGKNKRLINALLEEMYCVNYTHENIKNLYIATKEEDGHRLKVKIPANLTKIEDYKLPNVNSLINTYNDELYQIAKTIIFFNILEGKDLDIRLCNFIQNKNNYVFFVSENLKQTNNKYFKHLKRVKNTRKKVEVLIENDQNEIIDIKTKGYALYKVI